jgi:hypothetical protein
MFGIGVVLFFLARGISVWHAGEPEAVPPAEHHVNAPPTAGKPLNGQRISPRGTRGPT